MTVLLTSPRPAHRATVSSRERGMVLFVALIAMVAIALAAVALVRSVDTTTLISGNLAFRQSATSSGDIGIGDAITALLATQTANAGTNVFMVTTHPLNNDSATTGYYTNIDPALVLTDSATWTDNTSSNSVVDASGNSYRYIIQRMCRTANQLPRVENCLFSAATTDNNGKSVPLPSEICDTAGCPQGGQAPLYRVTVRVLGPKNTVSYIQSIVH